MGPFDMRCILNKSILFWDNYMLPSKRKIYCSAITTFASPELPSTIPILEIQPNFYCKTLPFRHFRMALLLTLPEVSSILGGTVNARPKNLSVPGLGRWTPTAINRTEICACGRVADREGRIVRVSDPIRDGRLSFVFWSPVLRVSSASPQPPSLRQQRDGDGDKQDYYVNLGHAIRTLREDYPVIFYKEPSFDIYRRFLSATPLVLGRRNCDGAYSRDDIVFKDPLNTFVGIDNYKRIFSALRFIAPILFKDLWVDIVSVWQPVESTIMIRWTVYSIPRVPWNSHGRADGVSIYKLDRKGKIFEHRVDNIARSPPTRFKVMAVVELIQSLGCPSTPKPTYFEISFSSVAVSMPILLGFLCIAYYLALSLTLAFWCTS
ncbi:hypothetical protein AXF42_Ash001131 [Apostasia shenzhenica]|uniref:Uncharacterized protein n=1 Tax=Apostasia shenzhenica TaxID=1088818 RepID=A0A2I0AU16_9ASPA|nr:hypothetical protein AXF42_Ash001131 [Apostasia shenzhenica]